MSTTPGKQFYDRQVALLAQNDVPALISSQYHDDAVVVGFGFTRRGKQELLDHFHAYMQQLGYIKLLSTDKFTETDDSIFFEATVETAGGIARVYDVFILRDGKATHHYTGLLGFTPRNPLTEEEIKAFVNDWYIEKLDTHQPMTELLPMLHPTNLYMKFPELTIHNLADFETWYQNVLRTWFDEVHEVKKCDVKISEDGQSADLDIIVYWEASIWKPVDRNSKRVKMDAYQTWKVERSPLTGKPVITYYSVDNIDFKPGSATL
jgi:hypothetical protein